MRINTPINGHDEAANTLLFGHSSAHLMAEAIENLFPGTKSALVRLSRTDSIMILILRDEKIITES